MTTFSTNTLAPLALSGGLDIGSLSLASCGDPWIGMANGSVGVTTPDPLSSGSIEPASMSAACFFSPFRLFQKDMMILPDPAGGLTVGALGPKYKSERLDVVINELLTLARECIDNLKNDDDEPWLAGTSRCFWNGMGDLMLDRVVQDLSHADPGVRWVAVRILGWMENLRSLPPLVCALEDPDPDVRQCAKDALKALHGGSENGALRNMMAVLETLGNTQVAQIRMTPPWTGDYAPWDGHFNPIESLMSSLMENEDALAGHVLAAIGEPVLGRLMRDLSYGLQQEMGGSEDDAEVRSTAAKVIGQMGHAGGAVPLMEAVVKEPSMEVRKEIGFALATCVQASVNEGKAQDLIAHCDRLLSQYPSNALLYSTRSALYGAPSNVRRLS